MLLAWTLTHQQIDERAEIATPISNHCYMTKAEQMREKVYNFLAPENESSRDFSEVLLTIVRVALRLDWEPAPVPVPR